MALVYVSLCRLDPKGIFLVMAIVRRGERLPSLASGGERDLVLGPWGGPGGLLRLPTQDWTSALGVSATAGGLVILLISRPLLPENVWLLIAFRRGGGREGGGLSFLDNVKYEK